MLAVAARSSESGLERLENLNLDTGFRCIALVSILRLSWEEMLTLLCFGTVSIGHTPRVLQTRADSLAHARIAHVRSLRIFVSSTTHLWREVLEREGLNGVDC